ncbi:hypothetical protein LCGC14_1995820 [marine sediment metagenome]|uniref:Uncharacterized protein n=1 Tax=marine sediment metagenome TaxID=412755 RepID=A0A0F9F4K5_9ZZZZ
MNWPVIGLLITLIVILFGSLSIAAYSIIRLGDNAKMLIYNLNYYQELANKYGSQLTRIGEMSEEFTTIHDSNAIVCWSDDVVRKLVSNIKSLVKIVGR